MVEYIASVWYGNMCRWVLQDYELVLCRIILIVDKCPEKTINNIFLSNVFKFLCLRSLGPKSTKIGLVPIQFHLLISLFLCSNIVWILYICSRILLFESHLFTCFMVIYETNLNPWEKKKRNDDYQTSSSFANSWMLWICFFGSLLLLYGVL